MPLISSGTGVSVECVHRYTEEDRGGGVMGTRLGPEMDVFNIRSGNGTLLEIGSADARFVFETLGLFLGKIEPWAVTSPPHSS